MATYVVSDLHGQYDTFVAGLQAIGFQEDDTLYVLGDAIDRGPSGVRILREVMARDNMDLIIGNHEFMMLNSVDPEGRDKCNGADAELWRYYNGGSKTYEEYLKLSVKDRKVLLGWMLDRLVIKTIEVNGMQFCLTHSNYDPAYENVPYREMDYETVADIVWKSVFRRDSSTYIRGVYWDYEQYTFITGHVPIQRAFYRGLGDVLKTGISAIKRHNLVNIDGGCAMGADPYADNGALFLRLDDWKLFGVPVQ